MLCFWHFCWRDILVTSCGSSYMMSIRLSHYLFTYMSLPWPPFWCPWDAGHSPPLHSPPLRCFTCFTAKQRRVTKPCFCCSPCTCIWLISPTSLQPAKFSLMSSFQNIHMILRWFDLTVVGKGGERRCSIGIAVVRFRNDTCMIWLRDDEHFSIEGFWIKVFDSFIEERLFIVS